MVFSGCGCSRAFPRAETSRCRNRWTQALQPDLTLIADATRDPKEREQIRSAQVRLISAAGGEGSLSTTYGRPLFLLMGMAALVFLVGCINLANLQLARLAGRQREIAVRVALGASRWRVLRQLLVEDSLLVAIGGSLALATCGLMSSILLHWASAKRACLPIDLHFGGEDFLVGAALLADCSDRVQSIARLASYTWQPRRCGSDGNRGVLGGIGRRWSSLLLAGQVSLSLLLLSMATLFARTLLNLSQLDAGLDREHVLSVHLDLRSGGLDRAGPYGFEQTDFGCFERRCPLSAMRRFRCVGFLAAYGTRPSTFRGTRNCLKRRCTARRTMSAWDSFTPLAFRFCEEERSSMAIRNIRSRWPS